MARSFGYKLGFRGLCACVDDFGTQKWHICPCVNRVAENPEFAVESTVDNAFECFKRYYTHCIETNQYIELRVVREVLKDIYKKKVYNISGYCVST